MSCRKVRVSELGSRSSDLALCLRRSVLLERQERLTSCVQFIHDNIEQKKGTGKYEITKIVGKMALPDVLSEFMSKKKKNLFHKNLDRSTSTTG